MYTMNGEILRVVSSVLYMAKTRPSCVGWEMAVECFVHLSVEVYTLAFWGFACLLDYFSLFAFHIAYTARAWKLQIFGASVWTVLVDETRICIRDLGKIHRT